MPPLPPADLAAPGWVVGHGQVVWTPRRGAPGIAGDLVVATNANGGSLVQFLKMPFPTIVAQTGSNCWQIHVTPQDKRYSGRGHPPSRVIWFQLVPALAGEKPADSLTFKLGDGDRTRGDAARAPQHWRLENRGTGEVLDGFLAP